MKKIKKIVCLNVSLVIVSVMNSCYNELEDIDIFGLNDSENEMVNLMPSYDFFQ